MRKKKSLKRKKDKVQVRFLKINKDAYIYEEYDGRMIKEICMDLHTSGKKVKEHSLNMLASNEKGRRKKYQDGTHPVTAKEYYSFRDKVQSVISNMNFSGTGCDLPDQMKLINEKLLIYAIA